MEIAFFDWGPTVADTLVLAGYWSAYWYNGQIYGSEISRGPDVFQLKPSAQLSQNESDAAKLVKLDRFNPSSSPSWFGPRALWWRAPTSTSWAGTKASSAP